MSVCLCLYVCSNLLKLFMTAEIMRWTDVCATYEAELRSSDVFSAQIEEGNKRWADLKIRAIEHVCMLTSPSNPGIEFLNNRIIPGLRNLPSWDPFFGDYFSIPNRLISCIYLPYGRYIRTVRSHTTLQRNVIHFYAKTSNGLVSKYGWWRGVVCNAFRMKQSYSTPGPVSTAMGDCLPARSTQPSMLRGTVK